MNHIFLLSSAEARRLWEHLLDPPPVHILWEDLVTLLSDLFSVERTNLFLVVPEKKQLRSRVASQFEWDIELPWDKGIAGRVYQTRKPLLINDITHSEFGHFFNKDPKGFQTRSMLTVPIFQDGDEHQPIVALVQLVNRIGGEFVQEDLDALKYWARQIGVTLERTHGTEIWRHPESEPPFLNSPDFEPVCPRMSCRWASLALPGYMNLVISNVGNSHIQLRNLSWSRSFWEGRELIKMVRDGYRHARIGHQLSGELSDEEKRIARFHSFFVRVMRWMCNLTRSELICHMIATYEAWLSFYASAFARWVCNDMPEQRNLLFTLVEDKRSHAVFYESLMLDYMLQHPGRRAEIKVYQGIMGPFYAFLTRHMVTTMAHVSHQKKLPANFEQRFKQFTKQRFRALWERAEARAPAKRGFLLNVGSALLGVMSLLFHGAVALFALPWALLWPSREFPALEDEVHGLLSSHRAGA